MLYSYNIYDDFCYYCVYVCKINTQTQIVCLCMCDCVIVLAFTLRTIESGRNVLKRDVSRDASSVVVVVVARASY